MRFWDSSALVPLVMDEPTSELATGWLREDDALIVWAFTEVEIVSALERRVREGALEPGQALAAGDLAEELIAAAYVVTASEAVKAHAKRLLRTHPLRAADSLQLAAALVWTEGAPAGAVVHTLDARLGLAARREGFRVVPSPAAE